MFQEERSDGVMSQRKREKKTMAGTISLSRTIARDPTFFERRPADVNWTLVFKDPTTGEERRLAGVDWRVESRFGKVENVVVCDAEGRPQFDRPAYSEGPNVNLVVYGRDKRTGTIKIAVLHEARPHADQPNDASDPTPVLFGSTPMGFADKLFGKGVFQTALTEDLETAARRETGEEAGARMILKVTQPAAPRHNPNPTFVNTWSDLYFVEVDLEAVGPGQAKAGELIHSCEFIPVHELVRRISAGVHNGAYYRMCTTNSTWMIFFATHPELFVSTAPTPAELDHPAIR